MIHHLVVLVVFLVLIIFGTRNSAKWFLSYRQFQQYQQQRLRREQELMIAVRVCLELLYAVEQTGDAALAQTTGKFVMKLLRDLQDELTRLREDT